MSAMNNRPPKTAMRVAQRIIDDVVRGGATAGSSLPPERVMLETYEIGRGTLREALRLLEFQGVITLKPGPKGGPVLVHPDAGHLATTLVLLMQLSKAPYRVVVEARGALEPMISRLAASRITDAQLKELESSVILMTNELHDDRSFFESNKKFHDVIAWASGNPLFGYLIDSLLGIMDGTVLGIDYPKHRRAAILKAHEEIYAALSARDEDRADERMSEHIDAYVRFAKRKYPEVLGQVITWDKLN
jgi:GntR family transcriptional regulator, transcriptional repressor for pyruvate dehydrogenase complex